MAEETEKQEHPKGERLRQLELGKQTFEANGKTYFIEPHVSAARFQEMQLLEIDLGFNLDYKVMFEKLQEAYNSLNEQQFADAAVTIRNIQDGIGLMEDRHHPIMRYCAMFINREKEDRRKVDELIVEQKIKDWNEEGIDYHSFFRLALSMVRGLKDNLEKHIRDTSDGSQK
jgi:hypothetical protein